MEVMRPTGRLQPFYKTSFRKSVAAACRLSPRHSAERRYRHRRCASKRKSATGSRPLLYSARWLFHFYARGDTPYLGKEGNGTVYGAVTLLEQYLDVNYWEKRKTDYPSLRTIALPAISLYDYPAFRYRQSQCYAMRTDTVYKWWNRLEEPAEVFAAGYWVHTFDKLLPSSVYGKTHPEILLLFQRETSSRKASQWCLTNPEVLEIVSQRIDSLFKAHPDKKMICVSQNDGNYTNCACDNCRKLDEEEGGPSGSLIHFINQLAARFPDKEFATLAYLYTMTPPKHVKPLSNVYIMLCDIDCDREVSLTENASGRHFVKALEGWSRISDQLFIWDYGINFDNYLSPFPNFHILQDNIRLFHQHHAKMHFSQIAGSRGGDFAELRTYLVSKLMWNPEVNVDSLTHRFLKGYYGEAAPFLYSYMRMMEGALIGSGQRLWIYDSPVSHKNGMLKPALMRRYDRLFDEAEKAVADKPVYLKRVRRTRLPLQYSALEIARTESRKDLADIDRKLTLFEQRVREFRVPTLNERSNSPVDYCELYRKRYMPPAQESKALGASVRFLSEPSGKYKEMAAALTDGLFGGSTFVESWVGWEGKDGAFIIDLGDKKPVSSVETDFLHQIGAWICARLKWCIPIRRTDRSIRFGKFTICRGTFGQSEVYGSQKRMSPSGFYALYQSRDYRNQRMSCMALWSGASVLVLCR